MSPTLRRTCAVGLLAVATFGAPDARADAARVDHVVRSVFDLAVMRPLDLAALGVGVAILPVAYVVALPIGGEDDILTACLRHPASRLFSRPLGRL